MRRCARQVGSRVVALVLGASVSVMSANAQPPAKGLWQLQETENKMDGTTGIYLRVLGTPPLPGQIGQPKLPSLAFQCTSKKVQFIIDTEVQLQPTGGSYGSRKARVKLDDEKPETIVGTESTSGDAIFVGNASAWLKRLAAAKVAKVEVTPFRHAPAVADFAVFGLPWFANVIDRHCGIRLPGATSPPPPKK